MADEMVRAAQRFVNDFNVTGIPKVEENGKTSWAMMRALTRLLQYKLGIGTLSDTFGPTTLSRLAQQFPVINENNVIADVNRIVQSALYCKGYDGGGIDGVYSPRVASAVATLRENMGIAGSGVTPKIFKALLNMDSYRLGPDGTSSVREAQQWLNSSFHTRSDFTVVPCDGLFSRDVQRALMFGIQYTAGMADGTANGVFGPATQQALRQQPLAVGSQGAWVRLFTAALVCNQRAGATFASTYSASTKSVVSSFQTFVKLAATGNADFPTWASLLVSYGDQSRRGTASDASTAVTSARLQSLKTNGYSVIGRYLCNVPGSTFNKMIQPGELARCSQGGLSVFPIYQLAANGPEYFDRAQGASAAYQALEWMDVHGFPEGARVYFAVDFDALDFEITDHVIPYFEGIKSIFDGPASKYAIGIYGARNVCSRVAARGLTTGSFVLDMSSGYSGNLGYPLPADWTFDQISTITVGTGVGAISIDNNIASGRDAGSNIFTPRTLPAGLDVEQWEENRDPMLQDLRAYLTTIGMGDTGSPDDASATRAFSTQEAFSTVLSWDSLLTYLARHYRLRKSLMQSVMFREQRYYNALDELADEAVRDYHDGGILQPQDKRDSSTGVAQITAKTAILSKNFCIGQGIVSGTIMDHANDNHLWQVWQRLNEDHHYNVQTIPLVLIHAAHLRGLARPGLSQSRAHAEQTISQYNGNPGEDSARYGRDSIGYYDVFESYNSFVRNY